VADPQVSPTALACANVNGNCHSVSEKKSGRRVVLVVVLVLANT
jgi:hypothetical protein